MSATIKIPRILLTNDDGIEAQGLQVLEDVCKAFAKELWVVAPDRDQSGTAESMTVHRPVFAVRQAERRFAVQGTPMDCVALALHHFMKDSPPDLVIAGINAGANVGDEVNLSGTLGAAFAALMFGIPAIGVSQAALHREQTRWETSRAILPRLLQDLLAQGWRKESCLSINIPDLPPEQVKGYCWTRQGNKNISGVEIRAETSPRNEDYYWLKIKRQQPPALADSDHAALKQGMVAVSTLQLDRSVEVPLPAVHFGKAADPITAAVDEL